MPWICPICERFSYCCLWGCLHLCWCSTFCSCIHVFMRCFQRLNCFTTNFCHQKLVKSHVRNERSDQARPGIRGGCGGLTNFFSRCAKAPPLCYLSTAADTVAKSPTEVCIYLNVSNSRKQNMYIRSDTMKPNLFWIQIWWYQTFLLT